MRTRSRLRPDRLGHKGAGPIILHKMSADGTRLLDEGTEIYRGKTAERPKLEGCTHRRLSFGAHGGAADFDDVRYRYGERVTREGGGI